MAQRGRFPVRWLQKAVELKAFTASNMALMTQFRNRLGLEFCFMEDEMIILGIRATRAPKGVRKKIAQETVPADREQAARQMIGPRGGLPTLKQDLIRLAVLVHVPVLETDTVEKLKAKLTPVCKALAAKKSAKESRGEAAASSSTPPTFAIGTPTRSEETRRRNLQEMELLSNQLRTSAPMGGNRTQAGNLQELELQSNQSRTSAFLGKESDRSMRTEVDLVEVSQRLLSGQKELEEMELDLPESEDMGFKMAVPFDQA